MRGVALLAALSLVAACGGPTSTVTALPTVASTAPATSAAATKSAAATTAAPALWSPIPAPAESTVAGADWIAIKMPDGRVVRGAVFRPSSTPAPVVLVLHGTEGFKTKHVQLAKDLSAGGVVAVAVCWYAGNYEGSPGNLQNLPPVTAPDGIPCPGGPDFVTSVNPASLLNLQALVAAVATLNGVRPDRVGVLGHSRGSVAALALAAATPSVRAVVAAAGYPMASTLFTLAAPVLMIQGTNDDFYPNNAQLARQFEAAMKAAGKDVQSRYFDGAPHQLVFTVPWRDDAVKLSAAFFAERLSR